MILETERLLLRNFIYDDLDSLYNYRNDPNCAKYQSWNDTSREYLQDFIEEQKNKTLNGETVQLAISLKNTNDLIGDTYKLLLWDILLHLNTKEKAMRMKYFNQLYLIFLRTLMNMKLYAWFI